MQRTGAITGAALGLARAPMPGRRTFPCNRRHPAPLGSRAPRLNGEDYNSDFLVMLNTWEGAVRSCESANSQSAIIGVARILGGFQPHISGDGTIAATLP